MAYNYPYLFPQLQQPQMPQIGQQTQASSIVSVRSEEEARSYPVAFGNSVTFKDENAPYIYTKTMGFSQLDTPKFERYKVVKEEEPAEAPKQTESESILDKLQKEIKELWIALDDVKAEVVYGA